ncbi:MAG: VanZ family protein [Oscillospiraceae bacterium]
MGDSKQAILLRRWLWSLFVLAVILFIFSNAAQPASDSALQSQKVHTWVNRALNGAGIDISLTPHIIRKLAHAVEYALLGVCLLMALRAWTRHTLSYLSGPLLIGLLVPVLDETIQLRTQGRSGEIADVLLDFLGVIFGLACTHAVVLLHRLIRLMHRQTDVLPQPNTNS